MEYVSYFTNIARTTTQNVLDKINGYEKLFFIASFVYRYEHEVRNVFFPLISAYSQTKKR